MCASWGGHSVAAGPPPQTPQVPKQRQLLGHLRPWLVLNLHPYAIVVLCFLTGLLNSQVLC